MVAMQVPESNNDEKHSTATCQVVHKTDAPKRIIGTNISSKIHSPKEDEQVMLNPPSSKSNRNHRETPNETFDWHKEILFGLFLRSDEDELLRLSKLADSYDRIKIQRKRDDGSLITTEGLLTQPTPGDYPVSDPSCLTVMPEALCIVPPSPKRSFSEMMGTEHTSEDRGALSKWKRKDFASQSLEETKKTVFSRFLETEQLQKAHGNSTMTDSTVIQPSYIHETKGSIGMASQHTPSLVSKSTSTSSDRREETPSETLTSTYEPFTLKYNECSIAAFSKWAVKGTHDKISQEAHDKSITMDSSTFFCPAASPFFKRCSSCFQWGHYDIECETLGEKDIMQLAPATKVQRTLQCFVEEEVTKNSAQSQLNSLEHSSASLVSLNRDDSSASLELSANNTAEKRCRLSSGAIDHNENIDPSAQQSSEEFLIKSNACEICGSGFRGEDLLLCDGCDGLFHFQCLEPPLESVPEGDWFCSNCSGYDSDVSSVCEVEGCEGFVIEQSKLPTIKTETASKKKQNQLFSESSWTLPVSIMKEDIQQVSQADDRKEGEMITCIDEVDSGRIPSTLASSIEFVPGDLCWAKRQTANEGSLGRDDWWPGMVMLVSEPKKKCGLTPYIVKFFRLQGAGRARASHILPFFPFYEEIGHKRLFDRSQPAYDDFHKSLIDAVAEVGLKSLGQALKKARKIKNKSNKVLASSTTKERSKSSQDKNLVSKNKVVTKKTVKIRNPSRWGPCEVTEEGGFLIYATGSRDQFQYNEAEAASSMASANHQASSNMTRSISPQEQSLALSQDYTRYKPGSRPSVLEWIPDANSREIPLERLIGAIVSWSVKHAPNAGRTDIFSKHIEQVQFGILCQTDPGNQNALVCSLPKFEEVSFHSMSNMSENNEDSNETDENNIYSRKPGPSTWVPMKSLTLVSEASTRKSKQLSKSLIRSTVEIETQRILSREMADATRREESMIELASVPIRA